MGGKTRQTPFDLVQFAIDKKFLLKVLQENKLGQYSRIEKAFQGMVKIDPATVKLEELEQIHGVGAKTARMLLLYTRPDQEGRHQIAPQHLLAAVAGVTATSEDGRTAHLELLLLPFNYHAHAPLSLTGLLAPFESGHSSLRDFKLTSWRYLHPPAERLVPRALRKLKLARGLMVYEGLR